MSNLSAIIMASGLSKRMGECKLSLPFAHSTVLETFLDNISYNIFAQVILVLGENIILPQNDNILTVINRNPELGQSHSLKLGIDKVNPENDLICFVADQPLLSRRIITELVNFHRENPTKIIVPTVEGENRNPVIFPAKFRNELKVLSGDVGGRTVIKNNLDDVETYKIDSVDIYQFNDIDIREDYLQLQQTWELSKN